MAGVEPAGPVEIRLLPRDFRISQPVGERLQAGRGKGLDLHEGRVMRPPLIEGEQPDSDKNHEEEEPYHCRRDGAGADGRRLAAAGIGVGQIRNALRAHLQRRRKAVIGARTRQKPQAEPGEDDEGNGSLHPRG